MGALPAAWVGRSVERVEDAALLTGRGRYIDDIADRPDTLHAAILRLPHTHARILAIRTDAAKKYAGRHSGFDWRLDAAAIMRERSAHV
jgi:CO/xanthine dehydrogenase Mo-binding subunit